MNVEPLARSLAVKSNDMLLAIYLSSLIRSILALHKLIDNKEQRIAAEKEANKPKPAKKEAEKKEGEKAAADGKENKAESGAADKKK